MLEFAFMQRALAAALLVGVVCGALGFFVILRRLAFVGVGISHSAIGGVALGLVAGFDPLLAGGLFAIFVALGIALIARRTPLTEDAVIGVLFSGSMALGVVLFSMKRGYQQDLFGYLFGNVLAISSGELAMLAIVGTMILVVLALLLGNLLFVAFDEEIAQAYGQPVETLNATLLVLLAVTVILGVRLVGILLIEALLVIPAAIAALWASNFRQQILISTGLGATCGAVGLAAAFHLDVAAGGSIVLVAVALFFASLVLARGGRV